MGLCTGACLPEQSQPWPLPNIGPDLDSIQLDSSEIPRTHSRSQAPTHKYSRIDDQNLYECKSALCYNRKQFTFISFTIKLQSNKSVTQVMYMFNLFYWALIYRVVHIFTLLHKMNWVAVFIFYLLCIRIFDNFIPQQRTFSGAINFTQDSSSKLEPIVTISATNTKASRHEKSFKQSTCIKY